MGKVRGLAVISASLRKFVRNEENSQRRSFATFSRLIQSWELFGVVAAREPYLLSLNSPARAWT